MEGFWYIMQCVLVEVGRLFGKVRTASVMIEIDNRGSTHLQNNGPLLRHFTAPYPRKRSSSYSPPWEPEISQFTSRIRCHNFVIDTSCINIRKMLSFINKDVGRTAGIGHDVSVIFQVCKSVTVCSWQSCLLSVAKTLSARKMFIWQTAVNNIRWKKLRSRF
jgi:hypothetical protein